MGLGVLSLFELETGRARPLERTGEDSFAYGPNVMSTTPPEGRLTFQRDTAGEVDGIDIEGIWGDFRNVADFLFPFYSEERNFATGERFYGSTLLDVQVNVDVPESEFGLQAASGPDAHQSVLRALSQGRQ